MRDRGSRRRASHRGDGRRGDGGRGDGGRGDGRVIACVFAHPDDETFSVAGTLAWYRTQGVAWHLYCATPGDAGRNAGVPASSRAELGAIRRAELVAAARLLEAASLEQRDHPDGALALVDTDALVAEIVHFLRRHRPQVVLTFGPEGGPNTHRDHRAISRAATAAFFLAGVATEWVEQLVAGVTPHAPARLFYVAWPPPAPGEELQRQSVAATARLDVARFRDAKRAAFHAHHSQRHLAERFQEAALRDHEHFALAAGVAQPRAVIEDLFDGL